MKYSYTLLPLAAVASADFTSIFNITATPDQVISSAGVPTPGAPGAKGQYNYAIDSKTDTICYDITLTGVVGEYRSPARTATHIHQGVKGSAGPPRIALPNPVGDDNYRHVSGCLTGPFITGINGPDNVTDTGTGFTLSQIEANPAGFFTDSHTVLFPAGVVRGQLDQKFTILKPGYGQGPEYPIVSTKKEDPHPYPTSKKDEDCSSTKKDDGHSSTKTDDGHPKPTPYPEHPEYQTTKKDDGHEITTATLTKTHEITISKCPETVKDCPYKTKPVVTKTEEVYTTVCPKSEVTKYPVKTDKHDDYSTDKHEYETKTKYETKPVYDTKTYYETISKSQDKPETKTHYETSTKGYTTVTKYETISKPYATQPAKTYPAVPQTTKTNVGVPSKPAETHPVYPATSTVRGPIGTGTGYPTPTPTYAFTGAAAGSNKAGGLLFAVGLVAALL